MKNYWWETCSLLILYQMNSFSSFEKESNILWATKFRTHFLCTIQIGFLSLADFHLNHPPGSQETISVTIL